MLAYPQLSPFYTERRSHEKRYQALPLFREGLETRLLPNDPCYALIRVEHFFQIPFMIVIFSPLLCSEANDIHKLPHLVVGSVFASWHCIGFRILHVAEECSLLITVCVYSYYYASGSLLDILRVH